MSNWSKEDKINYNKSEVFQELEKATIANIHRVDLLLKKAQQNGLSATNVKATTEALKGLGAAIKGVSQEANNLNLAEDQLTNEVEDEDDDEVLASGHSQAMINRMTNEAMDSAVSDTIVNELIEMKEAAIKEGNIKLAYKIERTLDEILEVESI
jgi:hypothetical protein